MQPAYIKQKKQKKGREINKVAVTITKIPELFNYQLVTLQLLQFQRVEYDFTCTMIVLPPEETKTDFGNR